MKVHVAKFSYGVLIAVVKKDVLDKISQDLDPFIDWKRLAESIRFNYVKAVWNDKTYIIAKEPFCVLIDDSGPKEWRCSTEFDIPDDIASFLHEEVKRALGLEEQPQEEKQEQQEEKKEEEEREEEEEI